MNISDFFPFWEELTPYQQELLISSAVKRTVKKGTVIHNGSSDCLGLLLVSSGQLRAYILSQEGREITIYRLFDRDTCMFSASCMLRNLQFDITIEAEKDSELWIIPPDIFKKLMDESLPVSNFVNQVIAGRFSEVMWLMEQVLWKSFDKRLAAFLMEESNIEESDIIKITHEKIANHLGTAREVVTRMLRYFQNEQLIRLSRGTIEIIDHKRIQNLAETD
ncbi:MAG TPA: Crp/Fnr family transcriptional regulator [Candidatus Anaerobutyricum stercoris]|uniref:Crp/Fnr family transcriptional regulator n=1 Tax=Candidatus Anaerobutyricum stercoris TaxID=2838457 RepID=A0A9D2J8X3_9FIRM|nr:Crp/Fnr family transcriptional regulator [Eubacterium sp. An3]OUO27316.1 Crp/Fnr family transcriptional regulator [Eubacterium sp. An3]HIZ39954.1 Crp/Fnr family transcriptional regulator [Candidatus Anaerobutyricum stercoris]